ncbi:amidohydrolase [Streptomyces yaizuensis]|uniref:Amidohydrolase n=1 Tax=Streptomyces yaizuensis TaxID=2989713 RepID=A0ABQ5NZR0_9ACTN|nr:amidohydrolase [Streptomyces sp. YSPA8]GLF95838.1 amidohydrolase [Streptomyces sp. YSPA8]
MIPPERLRRRTLLATGLASVAAIPSAVAPAASPRPRSGAALVVHNARVLTGVAGAPPQEAIAVGRDGRVLATGPSAVVRRHAGRDTDVVDAAGATVMSGIVDGHAHPVGAGVRSLKLSLEHRSFTVDQLQGTLRGFLEESDGSEPDGWLEVVDWNPVGLLPPGTEAHHRILDALPTRRPVALIGADGHVAWVNRRALDLAGIDRGTPDPPAGSIARGPGGEPTGILRDDALYAVTRLIPGPGGEQLYDACSRVLTRAAAQGVTTFLDAACTDWELGVYAALASSDRLPQRVAAALRLDPDEVADPPEALAWLREARAKHREVPGLAIRTAKVFLDGVIEHPSRSAALLDPYLDGDGRPTDHRGDLHATGARFAKLATLLDRHGFQVHAHAVGDRAVRTALDGYEAARRANGPRDNRHTIAHLQLVHPDDLPRFRRLGVVACMQLQWAMRNEWTVEALLPYLGERRHRWLYPARGLERNGAVLAGGSDWPVDPLGVWNQIRTAEDREGNSARQGALYPEREGLERASALRMHTAGSAYQLRMDRLVGRLTPGRAADLVVLDRDVTRIPVQQVGDAQVRLTLVGGKPVFDADTEEGKRVRAEMMLSPLTSARPASYPGTGTGTGTGSGAGRSRCGCGAPGPATARA